MAEPRTIGGRIDAMYRQREKVREIEDQLKKEKEKYRNMEDKFLSAADRSDLDGARGKLASAFISTQDIPIFSEGGGYNKFIAYVQKHKAEDLLQRRIAVGAYRERTEAGEKIPGVEIFTKVKVNLRKRS